MAMIIFTQGPYSNHKLPLPDNGILLGRGQKADLVLDDPKVSVEHSQVRMEDGAWCLFDLESLNGTTVNGHLIEAVRLNEGDIVGVGDSRFIFTIDGSSAPAPIATPAAPPTAPETGSAEASAPAAAPDTKPLPPTPAGLTPEEIELVRRMGKLTEAIYAEVGKVIVGQREVAEQLRACVFAGGHALLIGLPGMAKTLMAASLARVLDMKFNRVQFTSDLLPADFIGIQAATETRRETGEKESRFIPGPIFCNLFLANEFDRTLPKTQMALLEAMQENQVTAENKVYALNKPFFVLATENLIEEEGAFLLTEAQKDQFMFNIWMDYPLHKEEEKIAAATTRVEPSELHPILTREQVLQFQSVVHRMPVPDPIVKYVVRLVCSTRCQYEEAPEMTRKYVSYGAGPRVSQNLTLAAKALAVLDGRIHVTCADVRRVAMPLLRHRIVTNREAKAENIEPEDIIKRLLKIVREPGTDSPADIPNLHQAEAVEEETDAEPETETVEKE